MTITLYNNASDNNVVHKTITQTAALTGTLKNETNVVNPVVIIQSATPVVGNYAYIPAFGRYYYVNEVKCIRNEIYEIKMHVDVLMSFNLSSIQGILSESEKDEINRYLPSRGFVINSKHKTDIVPFPNGLNATGEYILITAGGLLSS